MKLALRNPTNIQQATIAYPQTRQENHKKAYCSDLWRCFRFALDTAALLGGNEFLVSQIYEDRCQQSELTERERLTLEWALNRLWRGHVTI